MRGGFPFGALAATVLAAIALAVYPLPNWLAPARPDWLGLVVIHWVLREPQRFGILSAWCLGLVFDGMSGGVLGAHALALSVTAYFTLVLRPRLLNYSLTQQMAMVALLCATDSFLAYWAGGLGGRSGADLWFLVGSLTGAACWPIVGLRGLSPRHMEGWNAS